LKQDHFLDTFIKKGVSKTHVQVLKKFAANKDQIIKDSTILRGNPGVAPVPADSIVSEPHYLHNLVRGVYKPKDDDFALSIQLNPESKWGSEITIDDEKETWFIKYDFKEDYLYQKEIRSMKNCYNKKMPIGVIYKVKPGTNRILGLGIITKVVKNNFTIKPYLLEKKNMLNIDEDAKSIAINEIKKGDYSSRGQETTVIGRQKQRIFRDELFKEYGNKCAMCNLGVENYLIGAHIVEFSIMQKDDPINAMNPSNGILLCRLCDIAFENGDIRLNTNLSIEVSDTINSKAQLDKTLRSWLYNLNKQIYPTGNSDHPPIKKFIEKKLEQIAKKHNKKYTAIQKSVLA